MSFLLAESNLEERQARTISTLIETKVYPAAIDAANKQLKKHPNHTVFKTLKALALIKSAKPAELVEAHGYLDEILASSKTLDEHLIQLLGHSLMGLNRHIDLARTFDEASQNSKATSEQRAKWAIDAFDIYTRHGMWQSARQVALRLTKLNNREEERYFWHASVCASLQAADPSTAPNMHPVLLKLAQRMIDTYLTNSLVKQWMQPDKFGYSIDLAGAIHGADGALERLATADREDTWTRISPRLATIRTDWAFRAGKWKEEALRLGSLLERSSGSEDWETFTNFITATLYAAVPPTESYPYHAPPTRHDSIQGPHPFSQPPPVDIDDWPTPKLDTDEKRAAMREAAQKIAMFVRHIMETVENVHKDGLEYKLRLPYLALFELERRLSKYDHPMRIIDRAAEVERYILKQGALACAAEDIAPYLPLVARDDVLMTILDSYVEDYVDEFRPTDTAMLARTITVCKIKRQLSDCPEPDEEDQEGIRYFEMYNKAYPLAEVGMARDTHPADDLAILSAQAFVVALDALGSDNLILSAICVLELANSRSPNNPRIRLSLTRLYRMAGCIGLALGHYQHIHRKGSVIQIKYVHHALDRASTFYFPPPYSDGENDTDFGSCLNVRGDEVMFLTEQNVIAQENMLSQALDGISAHFRQERYSLLPQTLHLIERLDNNLQSDLLQLEHSRMTLRSGPPTWEILRPELEEMRFMLCRESFDDRESHALPEWEFINYGTFEELTSVGKPITRRYLNRWCWAYLDTFLTKEDIDAPFPPVAESESGGKPKKLEFLGERIPANLDDPAPEWTDEEECFFSWLAVWNEARTFFESTLETDSTSALAHLQLLFRLSDFEQHWNCEEEQASPTGEYGWQWTRRDLEREWCNDFVKILHGVTLLHERWIFVTLWLDKMAANSRGKARKRTDPISEMLAKIRTSVQAAMAAVSAACMIRANREAEVTKVAIDSMDNIKQWVDVEGIVERVVQNRFSALSGLGMSIARVCGS
ncbi:N-acetyltransferase B complex non catalytic subunit-domain-containing protein [Auriculariales sp. MPI-PUGE-AT-0066]|nr:N-acetyltransferase B complex non catalytic subunit-domain-containing protein [Auriculariales sp. MPI-PUGE-AT-0066]